MENNFYFSKKSKEKLIGVHSKLVKFMEELIKISPHDFSIISGKRNSVEQNRLYQLGRTVKGNIVTNCDGIIRKSNHQLKVDGYGYAVDIGVLKKENGKVVYKGHWKDGHYYKDIYQKALDSGLIDKYGIEWAGNWTDFKETAHFQLKNARNVKFL